MTAPILLFTYNRPAHTRRTVEALQRNTLAAESELFIYSDAPKTDDDRTGRRRSAPLPAHHYGIRERLHHGTHGELRAGTQHHRRCDHTCQPCRKGHRPGRRPCHRPLLPTVHERRTRHVRTRRTGGTHTGLRLHAGPVAARHLLHQVHRQLGLGHMAARMAILQPRRTGPIRRNGTTEAGLHF